MRALCTMEWQSLLRYFSSNDSFCDQIGDDIVDKILEDIEILNIM